MGRLVKRSTRKDIIDSNVKEYVKRSNLVYSNLFEGTPTFVTYYSKDKLKSTSDQNLENVIEILGQESPIGFEKVENFILYGIDPGSVSLEINEMGANESYTGEAIILPNTLKPKPEDYFSFNYDNKDLLFIIKNVAPDKLHEIKYFKVTYELKSTKVESIEEQVTNVFETIYDNIGSTKDKVIIEKQSAIILDFLLSLEKELRSKYINIFHNERFGMLKINVDDNCVFSSYVIRFLMEERLLEDPHPYFTSIYIPDSVYIRHEPEYIREQNITLYNAIVRHELNMFRSENYTLNFSCDNRYPWFQHYERYVDTVVVPEGIDITGIPETISPSNGQLIDMCTNGTYKNNDNYFYENLIASFLRKELVFSKVLLEKIDRYPDKFVRDLKTYMYLPIILFILKTYRTILFQMDINKGYFCQNKKIINYNINIPIVLESNDVVDMSQFPDYLIGNEEVYYNGELIVNDPLLGYSILDDKNIKFNFTNLIDTNLVRINLFQF